MSFIKIFMKILVTGGAGLIGQYLVKRLFQQDYKIIVIDNLSNGNKENLLQAISSNNSSSRASENNKISFYKEDIRNKKTIADIFNRERTIDTCIHLAAKNSVFDSITNPNDTMDVNVKGTLNILEACSSNDVKNFIFSSSAAVYGDSKKLPLSEDHMLEPSSPYGASKIAGEALVSSYGYTGKIQNSISLRLFNVYGEDKNLKCESVITSFIHQLSKGLPPIIYGDGKQTRDFISLNDVVNVILLAAVEGQKKILSSRAVFNVGTGKPTMIKDLAQLMIKIFDLDLKPIFVEAKKGEIINSYADTGKLKRDLGFVASEEIGFALKKLHKIINHNFP